MKSIEEIKNNLKEDIQKANDKEINLIFKELKKMLCNYDRDSLLKNISDIFNSLFKSKRKKCELFLNDLFDSLDKLNTDEIEKFRKDLLSTSNIHRTFLEDLIALLEAL